MSSAVQRQDRSSTNAERLLGLEVLFKTLDVRSRADALVAAVHWIFVTDGLRSVANTVESQATAVSGPPSELLPVGWNENTADFYVLKYVRHNDVVKESKPSSFYLVKMVFADGILIVSVLSSSDNETASVSLPLNEFVADDVTNYSEAFKNLVELKWQIETELVEPLNLNSQSSSFRGYQQQQQQRPDGRREPDTPSRRDDSGFEERTIISGGPYRRPSPLGSSFSDDESVPENPPFGRGDLDPLGRAQGGMLMDPRNFPHRPPMHPAPGIVGPERLPRGAVPPGARFDPFGPPMPDPDRRRLPRFSGPDPDHLPPPGYDDMFG